MYICSYKGSSVQGSLSDKKLNVRNDLHLWKYLHKCNIIVITYLLVFISTPRFRKNYCNFAKVILARAKKDKDQIDNCNSSSDNGRIKAQYRTATNFSRLCKPLSYTSETAL
jgi:hypothetical protein